MPIRVLELRSVAGTGGGPDKTILAGARSSNPSIALTLCYLCRTTDPLFTIGEQARAAGLDYVELRERHALDRRVWKDLRVLVRDRQIDIVHGHEYKTDLLAYLLARVEPVIALATAHGWTGHSWRERAVYYPADKWLLGRFPRVVAVSGEIKKTLTRWGAAADRIDVLLNGIDPVRFHRDPSKRAGARATYGIGDDQITIGAVGRLEPQKRFDLLIEAFAALHRRRGGRLRLLIAGEGSSRAAIEEQIRALGLAGACALVGHTDVIPFHHALDLYVQSSDYEGTPNVVLEAMAMETPIVATDVGGTSELVADGVHGLLLKPGSADALAAVMERALADPQAAARRAAAARLRVETELSFSQRMARLDRIYEELAARERRSAQ